MNWAFQKYFHEIFISNSPIFIHKYAFDSWPVWNGIHYYSQLHIIIQVSLTHIIGYKIHKSQILSSHKHVTFGT